MRVLRRWYGQGPLHLLLMAASFALAGYAGVRLLDGDTFLIILWFVGVALVHDLVLVPLYASADRALRTVPVRRPGLVNSVRVPALLSGLLLLMWLPLITGSEHYEPASGMSPDRFLGNWLLITAVLFAASALRLLVPAVRSRRRARKGRPPASH
ncbi:hypothetical protein QFZ58_000603 [Streptomyces sp. B1I3]|nr:hypothetical protein [Streptomyces sp. B1I3]